MTPKAKIASNVEIGPYCVIGPNVEIGEKTIIQSHVHISVSAKIGKGNKIYPFRFNQRSTGFEI